MFGPLSRAGGTAGRRARTRVVIIVAAVVVGSLVVGEIIDQVVNSEGTTSARSDASFVAALLPIVGHSNALEPLLKQVRNAPGNLANTAQPQTVLAQLVSELQQGTEASDAAYANLGLQAPNTRAAQLIGQTLTKRQHIASQLARAVQESTGGQVGSAKLILRQTATDLQASDRSYRAFLAALPKGDHALKLPASQWYVPAMWTLAATNRWATALSSSPVLAVHTSLKIVAISLDPPAVKINGLVSPTTTTTSTTTTFPSSSTTTSTTSTTLIGIPFVSSSTSTTSTSTTTTLPITTTTNQIPPLSTTSVLPATSSIAVTVVVANNGNSPASGVVVDVTAVPTASPAKKKPAVTSSASRSIPTIRAGGSRYLVVGSLDVEDGASYRLTVTATPKVGAATHDTIKITIG